MNGVLIVDKQKDWTSHDVVDKVRKLLKIKKAGHTGTLDPFATGVLVVLLGQGTRLAQFLDKAVKEYEATIRFGYETITGDNTSSAKSERKSPDSIEEAKLIKVLEGFQGKIQQVPPMFSAKKIGGRKLYELARKGEEIDRQPVPVTIYEIELLEDDWIRNDDDTLDVKIRVVCSPGTYIRTLAEDIGKKMGVGAHLCELDRIRVGDLHLKDALPYGEIKKLFFDGKIKEKIVPLNDTVSYFQSIEPNETDLKAALNGNALKLDDSNDFKDDECVRIVNNGELLGVGVYKAENKTLQPKVIFPR